MYSEKTILIVSGIFFLLVFASGYWVRSDGKPCSTTTLTIHRLISLAAGVTLGVALYRWNQAAGLSTPALTAVYISIALFMVTVLSGGIWSNEKEIPTILLRLHQVSPFLTAASTGVTLYLAVF